MWALKTDGRIHYPSPGPGKTLLSSELNENLNLDSDSPETNDEELFPQNKQYGVRPFLNGVLFQVDTCPKLGVV